NSFNVATIAEPPVYGLQAWRDAFSDPGIWLSLWNTIKIAIVRNLLVFPLGVLIAWILARTNIPFANGFEFLFWLSFMLPSIAVTFGWMLLLDPNTGLVNVWLKEIPFLNRITFDIYSFWGIIWVHCISGLDTKVILLTPAFRRMDAAMEEASRMSGGSTLKTMFRVTLPVMTPALVVVFLLGVVRLFESFEIELLLGIPWGFYVYSTKILDLARQEPPLVNQAAALGSIVLLLLAIIIPLQQRLIHGRQYTTVTSQFKPKLVDLGIWKFPLMLSILLIVFLAVGVPILSVLGGSFMVRFGFFNLPKTWTLEYWQMALSDPRLLEALENTLIVAGSAALIGPILFSLIAYILVRTRLPGRSILDAICWIPSAIPGVLAGLGLLWMFLGTPIFRPFYGTLFLLMIAFIMGGVTLSTQILKASFIQLGRELEEASRMSGAGFLRTYFKIVLPLMAQTMVLIGVLKFLFAARGASPIILLATSETRTLALLALDQIAAGYRETASITVLLVVFLTTGLALIARSFGLKVGIRAE
ncbi:MAG: iron ABC transporter permease, partial [Deltaproteobacteria bacterium]|nr:iron ABC transporter permease [Deltaproteobacteria bacterium]